MGVRWWKRRKKREEGGVLADLHAAESGEDVLKRDLEKKPKLEGAHLELSDREKDLVLQWRKKQVVRTHVAVGVAQVCWMAVGAGIFMGKLLLLRKHRPKWKRKKTMATVASVVAVSQPIGVPVNQATRALFYGYPLPLWVRMPAVVMTLSLPDRTLHVFFKKTGQRIGKRVIKVKAVQKRLRAWGVKGAEAWAKHKTKLELRTTQTALNDAWNALEQNLPDDVRAEISGTEQRISTFTSSLMGSINDVFWGDIEEVDTTSTCQIVEEEDEEDESVLKWLFPHKMRGWLRHRGEEPEVRALRLQKGIKDLKKTDYSSLQSKIRELGGRNMKASEMACFLIQEKGNPERASAAVLSTMAWRKKFRFMTESELKEWSRLVFLHGRDKDGMTCLYIRLGVAAATLNRKQMDRFACAIISYAELCWAKLTVRGKRMQGQLTVIVDCQNILPFTLPLKSALYCLIQLDRNYPCLAGKVIIYKTRRMLQPALRSAYAVLSDITVSKVYLYGRDETAHEALVGHIGQKRLHALWGGLCHCSLCKEMIALEGPYIAVVKRRGVKRTAVLKLVLAPLYVFRVVLVFPFLRMLVRLAGFWHMFRKRTRDFIQAVPSTQPPTIAQQSHVERLAQK